MSWKNVIGQKRVKQILSASLERKRLAHAYLFSGPEGVGQDAAALELAKTLNCERQVLESCETCSSCMKCNSFQHPNIKLVFSLPVGKNEKYGDPPLSKLSDDDIAFIRDQLQLKAKNLYHKIAIPKSNTIKINSVREIRRESSLTSYQSGKKVFIVLDAERLSDESSNAILKTLEEPHVDTVLILTTSRPDNLLPTIVSRCQHIKFDPLGNEEIRDALIEREGLDADKAELISRLSNGSFQRALELTKTRLLERRAEAVEFIRTVLYKSREELLRAIDNMTSEYQKLEIQEFLLLIQSWLRDAMAIKEGAEQHVVTEENDAVRKFAHHHNGLNYARVFDSLDRAISLLDKNVYIPLILLTLSLELRAMITPSALSLKTARRISG
jgi:DNA polymerase III subunit delta'